MRGKQGRIRRQRSAMVVMVKLIDKYDEQILIGDNVKQLKSKKEKAKKCLQNTLNNLK